MTLNLSSFKLYSSFQDTLFSYFLVNNYSFIGSATALKVWVLWGLIFMKYNILRAQALDPVTWIQILTPSFTSCDCISLYVS